MSKRFVVAADHPCVFCFRTSAKDRTDLGFELGNPLEWNAPVAASPGSPGIAAHVAAALRDVPVAQPDLRLPRLILIRQAGVFRSA